MMDGLRIGAADDSIIVQQCRNVCWLPKDLHRDMCIEISQDRRSYKDQRSCALQHMCRDRRDLLLAHCRRTCANYKEGNTIMSQDHSWWSYTKILDSSSCCNGTIVSGNFEKEEDIHIICMHAKKGWSCNQKSIHNHLQGADIKRQKARPEDG